MTSAGSSNWSEMLQNYSEAPQPAPVVASGVEPHERFATRLRSAHIAYVAFALERLSSVVAVVRPEVESRKRRIEEGKASTPKTTKSVPAPPSHDGASSGGGPSHPGMLFKRRQTVMVGCQLSSLHVNKFGGRQAAFAAALLVAPMCRPGETRVCRQCRRSSTDVKWARKDGFECMDCKNFNVWRFRMFSVAERKEKKQELLDSLKDQRSFEQWLCGPFQSYLDMRKEATLCVRVASRILSMLDPSDLSRTNTRPLSFSPSLDHCLEFEHGGFSTCVC